MTTQRNIVKPRYRIYFYEDGRPDLCFEMPYVKGKLQAYHVWYDDLKKWVR